MRYWLLPCLLALAACAATPEPQPAASMATLPEFHQRATFLVRQNLDLALVNSGARGSFDASLQLLFDASGKFMGVKWLERSGNPAFDVAVEAAARRAAAQLPPAPVPAASPAGIALPLRMQLIR